MDPSKRNMTDRQANSTVLRQHYITPNEVQVPPLKPKDVIHKAIPVGDEPHSAGNQEEPQRYFELDGFFMLEATGMGFPEDAQQAIIADRKLISVMEDDMTYFTEMLYIDASENNLPLASFGAFPKLRELHLACNFIQHIPTELMGFEHLTCLDLSYNRLTVESIQALEVLPNLRDLDLSGNKLKEIPDDWQHYKTLEKLLLDYNLLENNDIFTYISSAPNLRHLSVYDNHLSVFPEVALAYEGFRVLDTLDLACNYFSKEAHLEPATRLPRIATIKLYGNPILGETGEDPIYIYIEGLVDDSIAYREANAPHLANIDFVTEFPKPRNMKKGQPLGRMATYRDFAIVQVDNAEVLTQRQWRERGNQSIFAETMQHKRRHKAGAAGLDSGLGASGSVSSLPDNTFFLTAAHTAGPSQQGHGTGHGHGHGHGTHHGHHHGHYGNDNVHDVVADDVMQRVAGDMGLISSAELLILKDRAGVQSSVLDFLQQELPLLEDEEDEEFELGATGHSAGANDEGEHEQPSPRERRTRVQESLHREQERQLQGRMQDQVPGALFKQPQVGDPSALVPQPVGLKTALKALQQAISQPLTHYDELPSKSAMHPSRDYYRPTKSSVLRQMPRQSLAVEGTAEGRNAAEDRNSDEEDALEMARYTGAPGPRGKVSASAVKAALGGTGKSLLGNTATSGGLSVVASARGSTTGPTSPSPSTAANNQSRAANRSAEGSAKPKSGASAHRSQNGIAPGFENPDLPANRYTQRGFKEPSVIRALRQEQRAQTLAQIDDVLQGLNSNTTGWTEKQALQAIKNANYRGNVTKNEKETMREMRDFAQPFTGVKSLLSMAREIEEEFNS